MVDMIKENRNKKMELLTDVDMLLMIEKGITGGIYHAVHKCVKANNKYMKYYDPDLDLMYWDISNLYGLIMRQILHVDGLKKKENKYSKTHTKL